MYKSLQLVKIKPRADPVSLCLIGLNFFPKHQLSSPRVAKGVKRTRRTHRIRISRFQVRPRSFKSARSQKTFKNSQILSKTPVLDRFLSCSALKTSWSQLNPRNSNSVGLSRFLTPLVPLGANSQWKYHQFCQFFCHI